MICPHCGGDVPEWVHYCPHCRAYISDETETEENRMQQGYHARAQIQELEEQVRRQKKVIGVLAVLLALVIAALIGVYVMKDRSQKVTGEGTTAPPETQSTAPATEKPSVSASVTDHFAGAKETFSFSVGEFSSQIGKSISAFELSEETPDESYGSYAYYSANMQNVVLVFTGSRNSDSAKLKAVCGSIKDILPGRDNYTYNELKEILGDGMSAKKSGNAYIFTYRDDNCVITFTGPYQGSPDAALDKYRLTTQDASDYSDETTVDESKKAEELAKENPEEYFKDQTKQTYRVTTEGSELNMRSFAGTDYKIVSTVPSGEKITVYGFYNGWAYAEKQDGTKGWVSKNYIEKAE